MNNLEVIRILNMMIDKTRTIKLEIKISYIERSLTIDKNSH